MMASELHGKCQLTSVSTQHWVSISLPCCMKQALSGFLNQIVFVRSQIGKRTSLLIGNTVPGKLYQDSLLVSSQARLKEKPKSMFIFWAFLTARDHHPFIPLLLKKPLLGDSTKQVAPHRRINHKNMLF